MREVIFIDCQSLGKQSVGHSVFLENILLHLSASTSDSIIIGIENDAIINPLLSQKFRLYKYRSNWKSSRS